MTDEELQLLKDYKQEVEKCYQIANKLDNLNPELIGSFTGTPSERIENQLLAIQQELSRLHRYDTELSSVVPLDLKDWHQNSKECRPEIAAWMITNLRKQLDWAHKEIDRLHTKDTPQAGT